MKSLNEWQNSNIALWPRVKQILTYDWIFTEWYEKFILWLCVLWSGFSVVRLLINF